MVARTVPGGKSGAVVVAAGDPEPLGDILRQAIRQPGDGLLTLGLALYRGAQLLRPQLGIQGAHALVRGPR